MLRGQKKGQDKGPEEGLFGETTQIKFFRLNGIWKTYIFQKHDIWWEFTYLHMAPSRLLSDQATHTEKHCLELRG